MNNNLPLSVQTSSLVAGYSEGGKNTNAILNNLNLKARKGMLIALIGMNGSGKSTLIHTLCGLLPPLAGDILIEGKQLKLLKQALRARLLSYVASNTEFIPYTTCFQIVSLGRFPYLGFAGTLSSDDYTKIKHAFQRTYSEDLIYKRFDHLSDGQKQRIMITRALTQDTPLMLLDEPTSHLDMVNRFEIMNLLLDIAHNESKTIIFSSHDLPLALSFADEIWLIDGNNIVCGAPEDLAWKGYYTRIFKTNDYFFDTEIFDFISIARPTQYVKINVTQKWKNLIIKFCKRKKIGISDRADIVITQKDRDDLPDFILTANNQSKAITSFYELSESIDMYFCKKI